jgi:low temperature requirement protein LtrA
MRASSTARLAAAVARLSASWAAPRRTAAPAIVLRSPRRTASVALRHAVERARLLHLLARPDRISFLQKLGEGGACRLRNLVLQLLR